MKINLLINSNSIHVSKKDRVWPKLYNKFSLSKNLTEVKNTIFGNEIREMLYEAVDLWGTQDIVTKMLSQRLDKEINIEQRKKSNLN